MFHVHIAQLCLTCAVLGGLLKERGGTCLRQSSDRGKANKQGGAK